MTREEHHALAGENETLARQLLGTRTDWAVTVFFYSALHLLDAVLAGRGAAASRSHDDRRTAMLVHPDLWQDIYDDYARLSSQSRRARYDGWRPASGSDALALYVKRFERVRDYLLPLI